MRHKRKRHQLNRFTSWRKATLASLARSVLKYQSVKTTKTKAQAAKPLVEELISLAKLNTLAAKREAYKILNDHHLVSLLFNDIGARFAKRSGGYTRVLNLGFRRGDNAQMALLELSEIKKKEPKKRPKKEKTKEAGQPETTGKEVKPAGEEKKPRAETAVKEEKPPMVKKPTKKFFGGLRSIFKKERDSL
ncbi:MAG: 50S ribosomal protein L17 [Candidatus Omnitrophota bacterium]|jgi:large subunit ribosomal protein L17